MPGARTNTIKMAKRRFTFATLGSSKFEREDRSAATLCAARRTGPTSVLLLRRGGRIPALGRATLHHVVAAIHHLAHLLHHSRHLLRRHVPLRHVSRGHLRSRMDGREDERSTSKAGYPRE